jgi:hypothetical protein
VVDPAETAFLAWAAAQIDGALGGLTVLAGWATPLATTPAAALGVAGLLLLLAGARWAPLAGALAGAQAGALAGLVVQPWLAPHLPIGSRAALAAAGALALGLAGAAWPRLAAVAVGAVPGAVLGVGLPIAGSVLAGGVAGAAILGALALVASDLVLVGAASALGAALLGGAGLALLGSGPLARELAGVPTLLVAWLAVVGAAGVAAQRGGRGSAGAGQERRRGLAGRAAAGGGGSRLVDRPVRSRSRPEGP